MQEYQTVKSTGPTASENAELNSMPRSIFDLDFEIGLKQAIKIENRAEDMFSKLSGSCLRSF